MFSKSSINKSAFSIVADTFISGLVKNSFLFLLVVCIVIIICFSQPAAAQSGRRQPKTTPTPPFTATSAASQQTKPPVNIESILIVGEIQNSSLFYGSNSLDLTLKECLYQLERQPNLNLKTAKGGKMNFKEAQDQAKKETDRYILWIGFVMTVNGYGQNVVSYADYTILTPESAKKLFIGRVDPKVVAQTGGVMGIPSVNKRSINELNQMKDVGREIIYRLLRWGWLSN